MTGAKRRDTFRRGGRGVFACSSCGKPTRETNETRGLQLCGPCFDDAGTANEHHADTPSSDCKDCAAVHPSTHVIHEERDSNGVLVVGHSHPKGERCPQCRHPRCQSCTGDTVQCTCGGTLCVDCRRCYRRTEGTWVVNTARLGSGHRKAPERRAK